MTVDDLTKWLGILGGVTGPAGLALAYLAYRRDVGRLRVRVRRESKITQGPDDAKVRAALKQLEAAGQDAPMELYTRDPDKIWARIEVTNVGRRKIRIQQIGWKVIGGKYILPGGFYGYPGSAPWIPCDLEEGQVRDFPVEDASLRNAAYVFVRTSTDQYAYGGFSRGYRGLWYRFVTCFGSLGRR